MKKKAVALLLSTAMAVSVLAGCGSGGGTPASSGEAATEEDAAADDGAAEDAGAGEEAAAEEEEIPSATFGDPNGTHLDMWTFVAMHGEHYGNMVEIWNEQNPDRTIEITCTTYPFQDMHTKFLTSLTAGTGAPDICDVEIGKFPNVVEGMDTWLVPLDDAAAPYLDTMVPARMEIYAGADGHYYGAPYHVGATVMYYNMAVLEEAGITEADVDAVVTWDDFAALGEKYLEAIGRPEGKY